MRAVAGARAAGRTGPFVGFGLAAPVQAGETVTGCLRVGTRTRLSARLDWVGEKSLISLSGGRSGLGASAGNRATRDGAENGGVLLMITNDRSRRVAGHAQLSKSLSVGGSILFPEPQRSAGGHRLYSHGEIVVPRAGASERPVDLLGDRSRSGRRSQQMQIRGRGPPDAASTSAPSGHSR